jgi:hypothetical protein
MVQARPTHKTALSLGPAKYVHTLTKVLTVNLKFGPEISFYTQHVEEAGTLQWGWYAQPSK